jgi:hypothetical protein
VNKRNKRWFFFSRTKGKNGAIAAAAVVTGVCIALIIGFMMATRVSTSDGIYIIDNEDETEFTLPLKLQGMDDANRIEARFILTLGFAYPSIFHIVPDDCLESLEINGQRVTNAGLPFCDFVNGKSVDLAPYLRPGDNTVIAEISNGGGDANLLFQTSWADPVISFPVFLIGALILLLALFILLEKKPAPWITVMTALFIAASLLRVFYVFSTPYWVRGHDTDGHIEYMSYIVEHAELPDPNKGWEYWQPPLYYALGAMSLGASEAAGFSRSEALFGIQLWSLVLSILTLGFIIWSGLVFFNDSRERQFALPIYFSVLAFFPGLILMSARINNDVLATALGFFAVAALASWWKSGSRLMWVTMIFAIALFILTKSNGILLLVAAYFCLLLRYKKGWKEMVVNGLLGLLVVGMVSGWFSAYRILQDSSRDLVGNTDTLSSGLLLENTASSFAIFNPVQMVRIPYNNPWEDSSRRQNFWEYWYRSAFFGEFNFGESRMLMASWILVLSFILFVIGIVGVIRGFMNRIPHALPMLAFFGILSLGHAAFRFRYPYSSSQDFRYSLPVLIPAAFFVTLGILLIQSPLYRKGCLFIINAFAAFSLAFLLHV